MKITSVLVVNSIEDSLPFWTERLGFQKTLEVPHEDCLGFVILQRGGAELMLQTVRSVESDTPQFAPQTQSRSALFIEVDDFADVLRRLAGYPIAMAERMAPYGMHEIGVFDPSGNVVILAARPD